MRLVIHIGRAGHHKSRRAEAALLRVIVPKCLRHGMQAFARFKALDCGDVASLRIDCQSGAGIDGATVQVYGAGAGCRAVADFLRACEVEMISQRVETLPRSRFNFRICPLIFRVIGTSPGPTTPPAMPPLCGRGELRARDPPEALRPKPPHWRFRRLS